MFKQASSQKQLEGVIGFFNDPDALIVATRKVREAKWPSFDTFTPFPVHGLDTAQGLKRSPLPFITFGAGLTGCILGFSLEYWTSVIDWPLNVGGKPMNSWPAFVPVMFECTILFAGLATVAGMFLLNRLPNIKKRIPDPSLTRDRFAILIEAPKPIDLDAWDAEERALEPKFDEKEAMEFLKKCGAVEVRSLVQEGWLNG